MLIKNEIDPYLSKLAVQRICEFNVFSSSISPEARADILTARNLITKIKNYISPNFEKQSLEQLLSALAKFPQSGKNSSQFLRKMDAINEKLLAMHLESAMQPESRHSAPALLPAG